MKKVYILEIGYTQKTGLVEYYSPEAFTSERKARKQIQKYFVDSAGFNLIKYNQFGDDSILYIHFDERTAQGTKIKVNLRLRELEVK